MSNDYKKLKERMDFNKVNLEMNYFPMCMKICVNYTDNKYLYRNEKVCLAKCIDRAYEYLEDHAD